MSTAEQLQPIPEQHERMLRTVSPQEQIGTEQSAEGTRTPQLSKEWQDRIAAMRKQYSRIDAGTQQESEHLAATTEAAGANVQGLDAEAHTIAAGAIRRRESPQSGDKKIPARKTGRKNRPKSTGDSNKTDTDDSVNLYLNEIGRVNLLTAEEEIELAKAIEAGNEAKDRLGKILEPLNKLPDDEIRDLEALVNKGAAAKDRFIRANLRLVVSIAKRYPPAGNMRLLDLVQEGNLGLEHAVDKFDWRRGFKFSTYATFWIRQAIGRGINEKSRTIRLPHDKADTMKAALREADGDEEQLDAENASLYKLAHPVSLNAPTGDDGNTSLSDLLPSQLPNPEDSVLADETQQIVHGLLDRLDTRARYAVEARFGLIDGKKRNYREIGDSFGVTAEAARRLVKRAVEGLKDDASRLLED